jgi:hypothetical protein
VPVEHSVIRGKEANVLTNKFTTFVKNYFVNVNETAPYHNGIIYPAEIEVPGLYEKFKGTLNSQSLTTPIHAAAR